MKAKKFFGQNFLKSENVINKIINEIDLKEKEILEIGPGKGALTNKLVKLASSLIVYEIDLDLIPILKKQYGHFENFQVIQGDFLEQKLNFNNKKIVIANIPYYITSEIIFKLFENRKMIESAILMVQKEVADRLVAKPNTSNYGKLSVTTNYFTIPKLITIVSKNDFDPIPKVDSAVIRFDFKENLDIEDSNKFIEFIKQCFTMQRKTLLNNLKTFLDIQEINSLYSHFNLSNNIRPQEIDLEMYKNIFKKINSL